MVWHTVDGLLWSFYLNATTVQALKIKRHRDEGLKNVVMTQYEQVCVCVCGIFQVFCLLFVCKEDCAWKMS